jgi:hypothetical protein
MITDASLATNQQTRSMSGVVIARLTGLRILEGFRGDESDGASEIEHARNNRLGGIPTWVCDHHL